MISGLQWAILLSALSAVSYAVAAVVQERVAAAGHRSLPGWAAIIMLTVLGAGLHVAALHSGTVGVVQAMGASTLLFALAFTALRNGNRVGSAAWRDATLTVAGLAGLLALTEVSDVPPTLSATAGTALGVGSILIVGLLTCSTFLRHAPLARSLLLAAGSGAAFAVSSVFVKVLLVAYAGGGITAVSVPAFGATTVLAVGGMLIGQLSYQGAGLAAPLATVNVTNPVVAAIIGITMLGEGFRFGLAGAVLAAASGCVAAVGVVGLARAAETVTDQSVEPKDRAPAHL